MFGDRLKQLRQSQGMTQDHLANFLNVSRQSISGYENDGVEPGVDILVKIADTFNISLDYLLGRTGQKYNIDLLDESTKDLLIHINLLDKNTKDFLLKIILLRENNKELLLKLYDIINSYEILKK